MIQHIESWTVIKGLKNKNKNCFITFNNFSGILHDLGKNNQVTIYGAL